MRTDLRQKWTESFFQLQARVAGELEAIDARIERLLESDFAPINEVFGHLFSKSGKMIRPTLLLLVADREKTRTDELISLGAAIELIHTASLVHDDSIDSSNYRRGVETLNSKWNHKTSVIIGDLLLARAFDEIARLGNLEVIQEMTRACQYLAVGEMRQMSMEGNLQATEEEYFAFIREKTGSLFSATCAVASHLSGEDNFEQMCGFGMAFGCIFQITDDMLDYVGYTSDTGKPTGLDVRERKMTLPLIYALARMDEPTRQSVREVFAGHGQISDRNAEKVRLLVEAAGGIDYAWSKVVELATQANRLLASFPAERAAKIKELVEVIVERDR
ncbi:MAG TPA: polyprenyl synthetase family protein [Candidatus Glassbacteria bacterium]|nr:polyprenyl synthetase family protein [Candidatus Glassbacteria bacterium]